MIYTYQNFCLTTYAPPPPPSLSQIRKKQRDEVDVVGVATFSNMVGASGGTGDGKTRGQMINERIGYKPHPKPNTLPSLFGNLQF